jgi:hypothetical protein
MLQILKTLSVTSCLVTVPNDLVIISSYEPYETLFSSLLF